MTSENIITSFESLTNTINRAGRLITGYFKAPATGNFRFKVSCNHRCRLEFDVNAYEPSNPSEPTYSEIASALTTDWRQYYVENDEESSLKPISDWFSLEEGKLYPIRGTQRENNGDEHFTVGLEFEEADSTGHYHANR